MEQNERVMYKVLNPMSVIVGHTSTNTPQYAPVFLRVEIKRKGGVDRLSITGVVGPFRNGNAAGSCGQITDELISKGRKLGGEWTPHLVRKLYDIWNEWHLNDMKAGTIRQTEFLRGRSDDNNSLSYEDACAALKNAGLYADEEFWWNPTTRQQYTPTDDDTALWDKFRAQQAYHQTAQAALREQYDVAFARIKQLSDASKNADAGTITHGTVKAALTALYKTQTKQPALVPVIGNTESLRAALRHALTHLSRFKGEDFAPFATWCGCYGYTYPGSEPYRYGHGWLTRELPTDVVEFLQALPETTVTPAWV